MRRCRPRTIVRAREGVEKSCIAKGFGGRFFLESTPSPRQGKEIDPCGPQIVYFVTRASGKVMRGHSIVLNVQSGRVTRSTALSRTCSIAAKLDGPLL